MDLTKNVKHQFSLDGMQPGDWFLGCSKCWFRLEPNVAAAGFCPNCDERLSIYYVREEDMKESGEKEA